VDVLRPVEDVAEESIVLRVGRCQRSASACSGSPTDYESYRPWLRDEFAFRCVYCLTRETWGPLTGVYELDQFVAAAIQPKDPVGTGAPRTTIRRAAGLV
jgi:hypothetical protein